MHAVIYVLFLKNNIYVVIAAHLLETLVLDIPTVNFVK